MEGYLIRVKAGGPTAANARRVGIQRSDWSLSLVSNPDDELSKSIVTVLSPRTRATHPEWTMQKLSELSQAQERVRISGWMLFGPATLMKIGQTATRWRIHPVLNIEREGRGGWMAL